MICSRTPLNWFCLAEGPVPLRIDPGVQPFRSEKDTQVLRQKRRPEGQARLRVGSLSSNPVREGRHQLRATDVFAICAIWLMPAKCL